MEKVSKEIAIGEINSWLDYKKVNEKKRAAYEDSIQTLVDAVVDGSLVLNDADKTLVQKLKFATDGERPIESLTYKPRIKMQTIHSHLQGVKSSDADGRVCAYIAALTSLPKDVIKALDTEDYSIGQSIAIFFL